MSGFESACREAARLLLGSDYAVFFGGAGVSTDSGLTDFRSRETGLYNRPSDYGATPEEILTPAFLEARPAEFFDFYRTKLLNTAAPPNSVHYALAELEAAGRIKSIITQNADRLHQRAGSRNVIELHGNVYDNTCLGCGKSFPPSVIENGAGIPRCDVCGGIIRPHILLFGEVPDMRQVMAAVRELKLCDLLIIGGTSLRVSSAPRLLDRFRGRILIINAEPTPYDGRAELVIRGRIGPAFEIMMSEIRKGENC